MILCVLLQDENYAPFMIYEAPYETILQKLTDCSQFNQWNALGLNLHVSNCDV